MLHDSLDLKALQARLRAEKRASQKNWILFILLIMFLTTLFFGASIPPPSTQLSNAPEQEDKCDLLCFLSVFIAFCPPIAFLGGLFIAYRNWKRRNSAAKSFLDRLSDLNLPPAIFNAESSPGLALLAVWVIGCLFVFHIIDPPFLTSLVAIELPILIYLFFLVRLMRTLSRGDYEEAAHQAIGLSRWFRAGATTYSMMALPYLFSGEIAKSEALLLQGIAQALKGKVFQAMALDNYAYELLLQKRFVDALPILETSIQVRPDYACAYDNLAAWYLYQNLDPQRALELVEQGLKYRIPLFSFWNTSTTAIRLATRAWAEARVGYGDRAKQTIEKAFKKANAKKVPPFAELNRIAGETFVALNDIPKAQQHFTSAAEVDPKGRLGKLASERLANLPQ